jgi:hypothetical protein
VECAGKILPSFSDRSGEDAPLIQRVESLQIAVRHTVSSGLSSHLIRALSAPDRLQCLEV